MHPAFLLRKPNNLLIQETVTRGQKHGNIYPEGPYRAARRLYVSVLVVRLHYAFSLLDEQVIWF